MSTSRRILAVLLVLPVLFLAACAPRSPEAPPPPGPAAEEPAPLPEPEPVRARILAVGDLLMHLPLVYSSQVGDDEWDFTPLFEPVRRWIEAADVAIANLETTLTGSDYPWSGYPSFNTPPAFARDLKAVGFDVITHANNHCLDYGEFGLIRTSEALEAAGLLRTGTARAPEEREEILVVEVVPEIRMAVLAYTYGTNGIPLPNPWSVNLLDPDLIASDIRRARQLPGVDLVAVALHFGEEYAREPNEEQRQLVQLSLEAGADIVLGSHPHVIQPIEVRHVTDAFGRSLPRAVIYSEGNFISNQEGLHREAGLMLLIDVVKEDEVTRIERVSFVPTWVHPYWANGAQRYRVVAVEQALRDYEAGADPLITEADYRRIQEVWADTTVQAVGGPEVEVWPVSSPAAHPSKENQ